jgi:AAA domain
MLGWTRTWMAQREHSFAPLLLCCSWPDRQGQRQGKDRYVWKAIMERSLQRLIVMAGLPGTGKSCIAEAVGRELGSPVFAKDWLEAALRRVGLAQTLETAHILGYTGYELLSALAERQLRLGQSAILDSVASTASIRTIWRTLATTYGAAWYVVECGGMHVLSCGTAP